MMKKHVNANLPQGKIIVIFLAFMFSVIHCVWDTATHDNKLLKYSLEIICMIYIDISAAKKYSLRLLCC